MGTSERSEEFADQEGVEEVKQDREGVEPLRLQSKHPLERGKDPIARDAKDVRRDSQKKQRVIGPLRQPVEDDVVVGDEPVVEGGRVGGQAKERERRDRRPVTVCAFGRIRCQIGAPGISLTRCALLLPGVLITTNYR